jgi:hypothetical protein
MESYCGGRSEVRIRDIDLPVILVDYTSNYPTAAARLNVWQLMVCWLSLKWRGNALR